MSKCVDEIIKIIKKNPATWRDFKGQGIHHKFQNIVVSGYMNVFRFLPCTEVDINGNRMPISYIDKYKLEVAVKEWYKKINLKHLLEN